MPNETETASSLKASSLATNKLKKPITVVILAVRIVFLIFDTENIISSLFVL